MRGFPWTLLAYVACLLQFKSLEKSERQACPTGQALEQGSGIFSFALESAGFEAQYWESHLTCASVHITQARERRALPAVGPCLSSKSLSQGLTPVPSMQHGKSLASLTLKKL